MSECLLVYNECGKVDEVDFPWDQLHLNSVYVCLYFILLHNQYFYCGELRIVLS